MALLGRSYTKPIVLRGADDAAPAPGEATTTAPVVIRQLAPPTSKTQTILSSAPVDVFSAGPLVINAQPKTIGFKTLVTRNLTEVFPGEATTKVYVVTTSPVDRRYTVRVVLPFVEDEEEPGPGPVTSPHLCHPLIVYGTTRTSDVIGTTRESNVIGSTRVTDVVYSTRVSDVVGSTRLSDVIGTVRATDVIGTVRITTTEEYC